MLLSFGFFKPFAAFFRVCYASADMFSTKGGSWQVEGEFEGRYSRLIGFELQAILEEKKGLVGFSPGENFSEEFP